MKPLVLNRLALVLAFAGLFVSGVLSIGQFYSASLPCGTSHGCDQVALHPSSHALGIPNAYLGFIVYLLLAAVIYLRLVIPTAAKRLLVVGYGLSAVGTLASLILTYIALSVIQATCPWCLASTAIMIVLLIIHAMLMQSESSIDTEPSFDGILLAGSTLATAVGLGAMWVQLVNGAQPNVNDKLPLAVYFPEGAHIYGDPNAPVTIVEFADLVCPTCQVEYPRIKEFVDKHKGEVKYVFRHCPLIGAPGHEQAAPAAIMAEIASEKGKFWPFVDSMYSEQRGDLKEFAPILDAAKGVGLDPKTSVERVRNEHDPAFERVMKDLKDASKIGVIGTPTFFLIAKGVKGVRTSTVAGLFDDLQRRQYTQFYKG